jgi:basic amino acid/polyamine antiporter, APA family
MQRLPRLLGLAEALSVVVGGVIGASIFIVPSAVAQNVPFFGGVLLVWIIGGLISFAGALTLAELAAVLPRAGGGYAYIHEALGALPAFLFAWTDTLLIRAGAIAAISFGFGLYCSKLVQAPFELHSEVWQAIMAILLVATLAALNVVGTQVGARVQVAGTLLKCGGLGFAIVIPFLFSRHATVLTLGPCWPRKADLGILGGMLAATVPVLWSYGGWEQLGHLGEEVREPGKNLPKGLGIGMALVAVFYLGVTVAIHMVLPIRQVAASDAVGADFFQRILGPCGTYLISVVVMGSAVLSANAALLCGPRSCFALARDGLSPKWLASIHSRYRTPANAILLTAACSIALVCLSAGIVSIHFPSNPSDGPTIFRLIGSLSNVLRRKPLYEILVSYAMLGFLIFNALMVVSAFVLRAKHPDWLRPYRTWGYPVTPLLNLSATVFLLFSMLWTSPFEVLTGGTIVALGIPVFLIYRRCSGPDPSVAKTYRTPLCQTTQLEGSIQSQNQRSFR